MTTAVQAKANPFSIRFPYEDMARLTFFAKATKRSKSSIILEAVREYFQKQDVQRLTRKN